MEKIKFWDLMAGAVVIFSCVNWAWGDKIHFLDFVSDPLIKMSMTTLSVFLISMFINDFRKR